MDYRVVALQAPAGFGKTAMLAHACRDLRDRGVTVAWLSVDEELDADAFADNLAIALEQAGIDTTRQNEEATRTAAPKRAAQGAATSAVYRVRSLIDVVERTGSPCMLALDEMERLVDTGAVGLLNLLLREAPPQVHVTMAMRERPTGLDIAHFVAEAQVETLSADDLRFSAAEIAGFFGGGLTRVRLAEVAEQSAGWPIALRILRNSGSDGAGGPVGEGDAAAAWIDTRLWRGVSEDDRDFVLDLSLLDWIDADLADAVCRAPNAMRRLASMQTLAGLLQTVGDTPPAVRLHPLIREHCATRRFAEDAERFCAIHRAAAQRLAGRRDFVGAMRHATESGDPRLPIDIAEQADGAMLWVTQGFGRLRALDAYVTDAMLDHPRLALLRGMVLAVSGDVEGASRLINDVAARTVMSAPSGDGLVDPPLLWELALAGSALSYFACRELADRAMMDAWTSRALRAAGRDGVRNAGAKFGRAFAEAEAGCFEQALEWAAGARAEMGSASFVISPQIDYLSGVACMALGRADAAGGWFETGLRDARTRRTGDSATVLFGEILHAELDIERAAGAPTMRPPAVDPQALAECGAWFDVYAASIGGIAELALLDDNGLDRALAVLDNGRDFARHTRRTALALLCATQRVSLLARAGRTREAAREWRRDDLPDDDPSGLELDGRRWREVEALALARLDLLTARGDVENARRLVDGTLEAAAQRGMRRTAMRILARAVRLEAQAGAEDRAMQRVCEYLRRFAETDYARPLAREREFALPLLERIASGDTPHADEAPAARRLRDAMTASPVPDDRSPPAALTSAELDVLVRLATHTDQQIATEFALSYSGVRYRIARVFEKLGARSRDDALHKARSLGMLPPE